MLGLFYDTVIFLKAGINGMDRLYRGFAHDENRRQIATRTALLALASMALYAINRNNELYDKLEMRTDDYPVLKRFYAKSPMKRTRFETRFYEMFREATELRRTLRQMDRIGRPDIADEIEGRKELERYRQLTRGNKALQGIKREMRRVYIDPLLDSRQKRAALDRLLQEKNRLLELVVTDIERQEAKQAGEKLK